MRAQKQLRLWQCGTEIGVEGRGARPVDVPRERERRGPINKPRTVLIPSGNIFPPQIEQQIFESQLLFPTDRQPADFRQKLPTSGEELEDL